MSKSKEFVLSVYPGAEAVRDPRERSATRWSVVDRAGAGELAYWYATERTAWEAAARRIKAEQHAAAFAVMARIRGGAVEFLERPGAGEPTQEAALDALERAHNRTVSDTQHSLALLEASIIKARQMVADAEKARAEALPAIAAARADLNK